MDTVLHDLRYGVRRLARDPAFTLIAVVCLALGIGANTTVLTAVNTLLLRPLPFKDPDRLVAVYAISPGGGPDDRSSLSYPDYVDWGNLDGALTSAGAYTNTMVNLGGIDEPQRVVGARVSASLFPTLGVKTVIGRGFTPEEDLAGKVVVLSHELWQSRFGGDRRVLGSKVTINGEPYTVVGVMEPKIRFPETARLWLPLEPPTGPDSRGYRTYNIVGRLAPGVTPGQARARAAAKARELAERYPEADAQRGGGALLYREQFSRQIRPMMLIMLGAVSFVLLIACANVANLLLARGTSRRREIAVRLAVGAGRGRVIRQLLTESLLIALLGGVLGALLGTWGIDALAGSLPADLPFWMVFEVDGKVLLMTLAIAAASALVFGLVPAVRASDLDLVSELKDGGRGTTGVRAGRLQASLVVAQLALSVVLLVGATLMIRSFMALHTVNPGFQAGGVLTLQTSLQGPRYEGDSTVARSYGQMLDRIRALPGVKGAAAVSSLPVADCCASSTFYPEGKDYPAGGAPEALSNAATPGYFATMRIPLVAGREFGEGDRPGAPNVAIVNRVLAERIWPGENPVGRRFRFGANDSTWFTVVGVAREVKYNKLNEEDLPQLYLPHAQHPWRTLSLVVRTSGDPAALAPAALAPAVRQAMRAIDPDLPMTRVQSMNEVVRLRMFESRVYGAMFAVFALVALLLASVGLYGVMSYTVAQRTHEVGVRIALGALPRDVIGMMVRRGARLIGIGLLIGVPAAFLLARVLRGALYGVSASDPVTFAGIVALLTSVALAASWLPARRAARVEPMVALRME
ncbi:MAG TPA: ABC transporter permease [Longimicrobium sp.]|nr:ABC transporter permease [Longimicrobium sp.]